MLSRLAGWSEPVRLRLVGFGFGLFTPYFRTNRCRILSLGEHQVSVGITLRQR